jgi:putative inorganic carbon (HCO3(-)) transporter
LVSAEGVLDRHPLTKDRSGAAPEGGPGHRVLQILVVATVALAPNEGYLLAIDENLGKIAPALLVLAWCIRLVGQRRLPVKHPAHLLLAALATAVVASTAVNAGTQPFALEYLIRWLPFLVITVVLMDLVATEIRVGLVLAAAVAGAAVAASGALYSFLLLGAGRASGPMEDPNDLAYVIVAALPLLLAAAPAARRSRWFLLLTLGTAVLLVLGAAATLSRGGALALLAAAAWLTVRRAIPIKVIAPLFAVVGLALVVTYVVAQPVLATALGEKSFVASSNVDERTERWVAAAKMVSDEPLLGVGPGGFRHHYTPVSRNAEPAEQFPVAHNMYLEVAAELGVLGFAAFAATIAAGLLAAERALRAGADPPVVFGLQAGLVAVLVASAFLSEQYYMPLWSMIAISCALQLRTAESRP